MLRKYIVYVVFCLCKRWKQCKISPYSQTDNRRQYNTKHYLKGTLSRLIMAISIFQFPHYIAKCEQIQDLICPKDPPKLKQDRTGSLRKKYMIARMEVDCIWFLNRMSRNQSCHSGKILNRLLVIFPLGFTFLCFSTFNIFLILFQDNKATGRNFKIWYFRQSGVTMSQDKTWFQTMD